MCRLVLESTLGFEDGDPNGTRYPSVCANFRCFIAIRKTAKGKTSIEFILNSKKQRLNMSLTTPKRENKVYKI